MFLRIYLLNFIILFCFNCSFQENKNALKNEQQVNKSLDIDFKNNSIYQIIKQIQPEIQSLVNKVLDEFIEYRLTHFNILSTKNTTHDFFSEAHIFRNNNDSTCLKISYENFPNYTFFLKQFTDFNLIVINQRINGEEKLNDGFFISNDTCTYYFGFGNRDLEAGFKAVNLTTFMLIDQKLRPIKQVLFWRDGLSYYSKFIYDKYNIFLKEKGTLIFQKKKIIQETYLSDIFKLFKLLDSNSLNSNTYLPLMDKEYLEDLPWVFAGEYLFKDSVTNSAVLWH